MATKPRAGYEPDLAYIHDAGFGMIAEAAGTFIAQETSKTKSDNRLVIDLGCGSGIFARRMVDLGYDVLGFDQSPTMIEQSRRRVPEATFRQASFLDASLPPARAVTAMGEVLCYLFDDRNGWKPVQKLIRSIHRALVPGGILVFDVVVPGRAPAPDGKSGFREGDGWACLFSQVENDRTGKLVRRITTFRQVGEMYQRSEETHYLKLFDEPKIRQFLEQVGFRVRRIRGYGEFKFPPGLVGFVARKP